MKKFIDNGQKVCYNKIIIEENSKFINLSTNAYQNVQ